MDASTTAYPPCDSDESHLPLVTAPPGDTSATTRPSSTHADGTPLPSLTQPTPNPSNCVIIIQNNYIAEGGTINIFSSHCNGSKPTSSEPPLARQAEPVEHGGESIVLSGNSFGECVMINVGSPDCTGAVKQTALASQSDRNV
ncbi:hypothetical protein DEU56DRAFT_754400 [Suillus clintonianus]|uniref:uncharacterized protein n=1 Tax=Suillus clintonianus TaxID=1904413 RepID=UPI001B883C1C|nr:uncharacterized protein DEU56DRAFT_754400 [Suillus clintonianus]KAG2144356.1 hypothetical protein DEU56DRAFT_754400 [Suillus clintonianus]